MFCKNCGTECGDSAFCPACGTPIADTVQPPVEIDDPGHGLGIAAMIVGIVSASFAFLSCTLGCCAGAYGVMIFAFFAACCGIVALSLGTVAARRSGSVGLTNKRANLGRILGTVGLIVGGTLILLAVLVIVFIVVAYVLSVVGLLGATQSLYY